MKHSVYINFYICDTLKLCLIDDPQNLLTNFYSSGKVTRTELPVWIRYKSHDKVSKFYVSALDLEKYNDRELDDVKDVNNI